MGESRVELLAWINDLLQLNYTKIEQLGTGAAYCQIMDSIYGNVQMSKIKFNAKMEYEYVSNFKVLQSCFDRNKVDKPIPVMRLVKCKMQDNLEFIQWMKSYWDSYFPGGAYDAVARRKSVPGAGGARASSTTKRTTSSASRVSNTAPRSGRLSSASGRASPAGQNTAMVQELTRQLNDMRVNVDGLEKERGFYFQKLQDIETLVQQTMDAEPEGPATVVLQDIQQILYSTEEGFDVPDNEGDGYEEEVY